MTSPQALRINSRRLWDDVMALAEITDQAAPFTRRSFKPLFLEGRAFLQRRFTEAGLATRLDTAGNLIGRREGRDPKAGAILIGSHSDTVPSGGRFDGIAGVATALEIARTLQDNGVALRHPLEVVDFLAEEPSAYGLSCIGSRGMSGELTPAMLDMREPGGETVREALRRVGGDPNRLDEARRGDVAGFFELHIEQGIVLESAGLDVGIVSGIVGITRIEIVFEGAADHAGTTPMDLRRDALAPAARLAAWIADAARERARAGRGYFVATVGILETKPGASNVVPQSARLVIDARTDARPLVEEFCVALRAAAADFARSDRVTLAHFTVLSDTQPAQCDAGLQSLLAQAAQGLELSQRVLPSGAGHDAAFMSHIAPACMVFIPCRGGKSHAPEEWTEEAQIVNGANVILQAVMARDVAPTVAHARALA
jgi:N-carbamoyl-L-amino-acid hydrolase